MTLRSLAGDVHALSRLSHSHWLNLTRYSNRVYSTQKPDFKGRGADFKRRLRDPATGLVGDRATVLSSSDTSKEATKSSSTIGPTPEPKTEAPKWIPNPERGKAAAAEVVRTGRLPKEYRPAARKVTALMIGSAILIALTPTVWDRVVLKKERKHFGDKTREGATGVLGEKEGLADGAMSERG